MPAWVAPHEAIARLLEPFGEVRPMNQYSSDVSDGFLSALIGECKAHLGCDPAVFVGCWLSESGLTSHAQNKQALAAGFFQAMPAILRGLAFTGDGTYTEPTGAYARAKLAGDKTELRALDQALSDAFCRLPLESQLPWAARYYRPRAGKFPNGGATYAANFCPAWIGHASDPTWVICAKDGRSAGGLTPASSEEWYRENAGLDVDGDGAVTMGDLAARAAHYAATPRGKELVARLQALQTGAQPDVSSEVAELTALASEPPDLDDAS